MRTVSPQGVREEGAKKPRDLRTNRPRLLAAIGIVLGLAICYVAQLDSTPYGCFQTPCYASPPPEDVVSGYVFYGGIATILVSMVALAFSSKHPKAISRVCYSMLVIGLVVLAGSRLYYVDPIIFIPNVTLSGSVASPSNATPTQVSFVVCTVEPNPPRCDPEPNAQSHDTAIQQRSYSINLPNGLSYNTTVTYAQGFLCPTQFITLMSYSSGMSLTGALGCYATKGGT
jgi:hypothetical protein